MQGLRLSVVVVSAGRPRALARCLTGLSQMHGVDFEVIVVADTDGLDVAGTLPFSDRLALVAQDAPNISVARNAGIAASAGEIVAFIDDDAVPEPTWAAALLACFGHAGVDAVTGPVLGRNGISLQWGRMAVDAQGRDRWLEDGESTRPGEVLKLHGTNMAFRRSVLIRTGGFDPAFSFYMDETDLTRRLAAAGGDLRYARDAVVHHGFRASARRTDDRLPLSLFDIGASTAVFLRKHAPADVDAALQTLEEDQRGRLLRLARKRKLDPAQMRALMESLVRGMAEGRDRVSDAPAIAGPTRAFQPLRHDPPPPMTYLHGWAHRGASLRSQAAAHVREGRPTSLILLEPTPRKHRIAFTDGGWWEQTGGLYGPSVRTGARIQMWRYPDRVAAEIARSAALRGQPAS
jgi:GT2 family glycosyltransferase